MVPADLLLFTASVVASASVVGDGNDPAGEASATPMTAGAPDAFFWQRIPAAGT
jgi:hypothetical protein